MLDFYDAILGAETIGGGGGGGSATLITKNIDANGTYSASSDNADGYSAVTVEVPNTYTASDEGKVVDNGALVAQTSSSTTSNGTVDTTTISSLTVNVANSYTAEDEGKVVDNGALVAQTAYPSTITTNNTYDTTNYNSITVNVSGGGATPVESKDVNFYDYDGTIVYSYTAAEFAELSALPANPTHTGLTAQGWNWTLSDAQSLVASSGMLDIGQNYITDDGDTRIYVNITSYSLYPRLILYISEGSELEIDWGDNTSKDTVTYIDNPDVTIDHTYQTEGNYVIKIKCISGYYGLSNLKISSNYYSFFSYNGTDASVLRTYSSRVRKVELGSGIKYLISSFSECYNLETITIPTSLQRIGSYPNSISSQNTFYKCVSIKAIILNPSIYNIIVNLTFGSCYNLNVISIPKGIRIDGISCLSDCYSLKRIVLQGLVSSNSALSNCTSLKYVILPENSNINLNASYCFSGDYNLETITIPSSVSSIASNAFNSCYSLKTITINKAEGSITNAPWGAPNATVVWTG